MEDKNLTLEQEAQIKEKAAALKAEKKNPQGLSNGRVRRHGLRREGVLRRLHGRADLPAVLEVHGGIEEGRGERHASARPRLLPRRRQGVGG